jgi:uncharacterized membrane protein YcaP (DUF421 family)
MADARAPVSELFGGASGVGWAALKAVLMFAVSVAGLRIGERRTLAQLGVYDFAVAVAVGALIARTATSSTTSFATGAVALVTLLVAHRGLTLLRRHHLLGPLVDAPPRVLIADGRPQRRELAKAGLTLNDVVALLRVNNVTRIEDVQYMLYESRGALTLVKGNEPVGPLVLDGLAAARFSPAGPGRPARSANVRLTHDADTGRSVD